MKINVLTFVAVKTAPSFEAVALMFVAAAPVAAIGVGLALVTQHPFPAPATSESTGHSSPVYMVISSSALIYFQSIRLNNHADHVGLVSSLTNQLRLMQQKFIITVDKTIPKKTNFKNPIYELTLHREFKFIRTQMMKSNHSDKRNIRKIIVCANSLVRLSSRASSARGQQR